MEWFVCIRFLFAMFFDVFLMFCFFLLRIIFIFCFAIFNVVMYFALFNCC